MGFNSAFKGLMNRRAFSVLRFKIIPAHIQTTQPHLPYNVNIEK